MGKNLTTKKTIDNLAGELKKKFDSHEAGIAAAFKSGKVDGNTVTFYTSEDKSGDPAFTLDFPAEMFLDQTKTAFAPEFTFSEEIYPGATDPELDGKPVMVLAVKGDDDVTYSFLNMAALVDTYKAKTEGKNASTTIEISGYEVEVKVNISADEGNILQLKDDGLYVPSTAIKVEGAMEGNLTSFGANGSLTDSGKKPGDFVEKVFVDGEEDAVIHVSDISDYTAEEIAAMLNGSEAAG